MWKKVALPFQLRTRLELNTDGAVVLSGVRSGGATINE
jgi:hypothetical protein